MRLIDADALYDALREAGMLFALRMVETAPTIAPPPNPPLAMEELRGMDGQTAWCEDYQCGGIISVDCGGRWDGVPFLVCRLNQIDRTYNIEERELTIYRRKPEEREK